MAAHDVASFLLWSRYYEELRQPTMSENALARGRNLTPEPYGRCPEFNRMAVPGIQRSCERQSGVRDRGLGPDEQPFSHPMYWASFVHCGA
jgi:CHAT domain-containing protein